MLMGPESVAKKKVIDNLKRCCLSAVKSVKTRLETFIEVMK